MQKEYNISIAKITTGIITAIVIGGIGSIYGFIRISDTNTILVRANESDITEIKTQLVPRSEWELQSEHTNRELLSIDDKLDSLLLR